MTRHVLLSDLVAPAEAERAGSKEFIVLSMTSSAGLVPQASIFKKTIASKDLTNYKVVRPNQLVVGIHIDEGALGFSGPDQVGIVSPAYTIWTLKKPALVHVPYLDRFIRSPHAIAYFISNYRQTAERRGKLTHEQFLALKVPFPSLEEQQRIAAILDQADVLRLKRQKALTQLNSLTESVFIEMFGDPKKNPRGWQQKTLKELGRITTGGTPPSSYEGMFGGETPFVTPGDLESNVPVRRTLSLAGAEKVGTVRAGATLVCCIGATIGKIGQTVVESAFNQQLNAVEWGAEIADDYGLEVMRFFKPTIIAWGASTTLPILKKSSFEKIEIPVPPKSLQERFAKLVVAQRKLAAKNRSNISELDNLFKSLQARAFQGTL